jgi:hypothetical protein
MPISFDKIDMAKTFPDGWESGQRINIRWSFFHPLAIVIRMSPIIAGENFGQHP